MQQRALWLVLSAIPVIVRYMSVCGRLVPLEAMLQCLFSSASGSEHLWSVCKILTFSLGVCPIFTLIVTWVATGPTPDYKRSIALPLFYSIGNQSRLVSSQLYLTNQGLAIFKAVRTQLVWR